MKRLLFAGFLMTLALLSTERAHAAGWGLYAEYVYQDGSINYDLFPSIQRDFSSSDFGMGFVFDNNVAMDRLINYRLDTGYQASKRTYSGDVRYHGNSWVAENTLGFGFIRRQDFRVWAGPAVRLMFTRINVPGDNDTEFHFGGGVRGGVNIHAGRVVTLSFTAGYRYLGLWGFEGNGRVGSDYTGGNHVITANFALLFRSQRDRFDLTRYDQTVQR
jgi:hypothetical protein